MRAEDLVTFNGFLSTFWKECRRHPEESQYSIFNRLNDCYYDRFGEDRFISFDAFRKRRDRLYKRRKH